jgi:hypothetical protein
MRTLLPWAGFGMLQELPYQRIYVQMRCWDPVYFVTEYIYIEVTLARLRSLVSFLGQPKCFVVEAKDA